MKKKVIQIGGNLRINGISSFIMTLYRNLYQDFQFIFINTAQGGDYFRKETKWEEATCTTSKDLP